MKNAIAEIYKTQRTVLTSKELALIWSESRADNLKTKIRYYVKQGSLIPLTRGVFATRADYNVKELASRIYTPSYISFESVLREKGVIFQHYEATFIACPYSKIVSIKGNNIVCRKLKDSILFNAKGVDSSKNCNTASLERAFLDMIYLSSNYYFDNLQPVKWERCFELLDVYNNKELEKRVGKYYKKHS